MTRNGRCYTGSPIFLRFYAHDDAVGMPSSARDRSPIIYRKHQGVDAGVGLEGDTTLGSFQIRNDSFEAGKSQIVMSLKAGLISKGVF
jgi:hypothetical protein